jgi:hypothetical protein
MDLLSRVYRRTPANIPLHARLGKPQWNSFRNQLILPKKIQPAPEGAG